MRLVSLQLTNFQGIRDARFDFNELNTNIFGDNATGKTTIFNAVTWLLFDKASTGAKNFTPKTKGSEGDLHYLDHGVEACFSLGDGQQLALKKIYKESYKKKRGSAVEEFDGHVVGYYIDGVPVKEKEYMASLNNNIGPEEHMKMLMMPDYFSEALPWETRRRILLEMCGDITDQDIIDGNPDLRDLSTYLSVPGTTRKYYTVDEYKRIAAAKRADINRELQTIPARIDEARKAMPDISGIDMSAIDLSLHAANLEIEDKEQEKRQILSGDMMSDSIRKQISSLQTKLAEDRAVYATECSKKNEAVYIEIEGYKAERLRINKALTERRNTLESKRLQLESMKSRRQTLLDMYEEVAKEQWQGDENCPTCKRALPEDEVTAARESFNISRSKKLERINQSGQQECSKDMIAALESEISELSEKTESLEFQVGDFDGLISETEQKLKRPAPFESTAIYATAMQQIKELRDNENDLGAVTSQQVVIINAQIASIRKCIDELMADKSKLTLAEHQAKRMEELAAKEKLLSREYDYLQRGVYLCEEFIKSKVSMLTDKINGKFESVRFRLFIEQINGGIKEDCEVMVPGDGKMVPYTFANNAARINAGLEIINALSRHWDISIPVFVDNAESVTRLQDIDSQLIRLVVSEPDKKLRMEIAA